MFIQDYLIDQDGIEWQPLLEAWRWLLPSEFTLWLVNRFAELVIVTADGAVHFVDTSCGTIEVLGASRQEFTTKVDEDDNAYDWFAISLVDQCVAAGLTLSRKQCYGYKIPPSLSGKFELENVEVVDIEVYLHLTGQLQEAIKDLPDGAQIGEIRIGEDKSQLDDKR